MANYQKRRQKALLKKRRKEKERRKKQSRSSSYYEYAHSAYVIKNAKNYPLFECLINTDWQDKGMAHIFLSRKKGDDSVMNTGLRFRSYIENTLEKFPFDEKEKI